MFKNEFVEELNKNRKINYYLGLIFLKIQFGLENRSNPSKKEIEKYCKIENPEFKGIQDPRNKFLYKIYRLEINTNPQIYKKIVNFVKKLHISLKQEKIDITQYMNYYINCKK